MAASESISRDTETSFFSTEAENGTCGNPTMALAINQISDDAMYLRLIAEYIYIISSPIITILGVIGNFLTLVIMTRKSFRFTSVAVYLSAAAISDSLVLVTEVLNNWFKAVLKISLLGTSDGFCKFHRFFFNVVYTYSAWIVTSVCIERFIVVWFPLRAKRICSYRNTVVTVSVMPVPICALYLYNLWAWHSDGRSCLMVSSWFKFQSDIGPWMSAFAYSYFPVVVMVILNAAIIGRLSLARRRRRQMLVETSATVTKETLITVTIVVICICYVIMTVPLSIYYILAFKYGEFMNANPKFYFARAIVIMVSLCSYATTFFLYVLTSSAFRKQLRKLFCCYRQHHPAVTAGTAGTSLSVVNIGAERGGGIPTGGSNISIAISSDATKSTDVNSVTALESYAPPTSENTSL